MMVCCIALVERLKKKIVFLVEKLKKKNTKHNKYIHIYKYFILNQYFLMK
jgi:hypothetical protein